MYDVSKYFKIFYFFIYLIFSWLQFFVNFLRSKNTEVPSIDCWLWRYHHFQMLHHHQNSYTEHIFHINISRPRYFYKKCVGATNYLLYVNLLILLPLIKSNASFHVLYTIKMGINNIVRWSFKRMKHHHYNENLHK